MDSTWFKNRPNSNVCEVSWTILMVNVMKSLIKEVIETFMYVICLA